MALLAPTMWPNSDERGVGRLSVDWPRRLQAFQHVLYDPYHFGILHSENISGECRSLKAPRPKAASALDNHSDAGQGSYEGPRRLVRCPAMYSHKIVSNDISHGESLWDSE